jgi:RimJ/RimL family protein N-acetyltransferase
MLKGDAITLTSIGPDDSEALYRWINDPELVRHNAPYAPVHYPSHVAWLQAIVQRPNFYIFAIRVVDLLVGTCQLFDVHPVHRSAEFQIRIGEAQARGKGYGTDALRTCLRFAQRDLSLHSVWLRTFASNAAAIRCYQKAGLQPCGRLREYAFIDGQWLDMVIMQIVFDT